MTIEQIILILIVALPMALVVRSLLRIDQGALLIAALLGLAQLAGMNMLGPGGRADVVKAIAGFSQPTVITLLGLFIISFGLEKSGITRWVARRIIEVGGHSETRLIVLFAATAAFFSLFMNNLAAGALLLPSAIETARRTGVHPGKLLIPVAYGSLLGGSATYFTTANIIVSDLLTLAKPAQQPLNMLHFLPTGGLIAIVGILYLALLGRRLLPDRPGGSAQPQGVISGSEMEDFFQLKERLWLARVQPDSPLIGKSLSQTSLGTSLGVTAPAVTRGSHTLFPAGDSYHFAAGDTLLVIGREERIARLPEEGLTLVSSETTIPYLSARGVRVYELVLSPHSAAIGKTLKGLGFRRQYGFTVVALKRKDRSFRTDVGDLPLETGDSLLVVGPRGRLKALRASYDFLMIEPNLYDQPVDRREAALMIAVILAIVIFSSLGVPTFLAVLAGVLVISISGAISMEEAYRSIEWPAIFLIAGMYAVSLAMVETRFASLLGNAMIRLVAPIGPLGLAAGGFLLTALLTQVMGGQVTALVTGPVTIAAAIQMGVNPQAVAVATAIGCSASFFTPLAHPVNILMIAPGNYTFGDFFRVGWLLTIVCFVVLIGGMALFWGL